MKDINDPNLCSLRNVKYWPQSLFINEAWFFMSNQTDAPMAAASLGATWGGPMVVISSFSIYRLCKQVSVHNLHLPAFARMWRRSYRTLPCLLTAQCNAMMLGGIRCPPWLLHADWYGGFLLTNARLITNWRARPSSLETGSFSKDNFHNDAGRV